MSAGLQNLKSLKNATYTGVMQGDHVHKEASADGSPQPGSGDQRKMVQRNLTESGIREISRTRMIALRREKMGESSSDPDLEAKPASTVSKTHIGGFDKSLGVDVYPLESIDEFYQSSIRCSQGVLNEDDISFQEAMLHGIYGGGLADAGVKHIDTVESVSEQPPH